MKARDWRYSMLLVASLALLVGCKGDKDGHDHEVHETHEIELFEQGKGVHLPEELKRTLALETAEVTEKSVTPILEKRAQVFRTAEGERRGSAVVWLSEAESKGIRVGQEVRLRVIGVTDEIFGSVARKGNATGGQVEALIEFSSASKGTQIGAILTAKFVSPGSHTAMAIPKSAVIDGVSGPFVYAANGEHFVHTPIKVGATESAWVEVTDGLYAGDIVVTKSADSLWLIELCARKGGSPCCPVPMKK